MNKLITELEINNFKSIKHVKMDCKRINVFIGKPNVGKSNILEALSLFIAPYGDPNKKMLEDYIRYEKLSNLFYDQDRKNQVSVKTNLGFAALRFHPIMNSYDIALSSDINWLSEINSALPVNTFDDLAMYLMRNSLPENKDNKADKIKPYYAILNSADKIMNSSPVNYSGYNTSVKNYRFRSLTEHKNNFASFLNPPFGDNLYTILEGNPKLYDECAGLFNQYGLDLLLDTESEKIDVQKKVDRRVFKIPYSLAADTLQRFIFHIAAIETNKESVLLFEEPESHSFPRYISDLADKIIENESNQYFIATHSPYLLMPFIEQCSPDDIGIFIATYEEYETKVKALTKEEIQNILDTGADIFFNLRAFQG